MESTLLLLHVLGRGAMLFLVFKGIHGYFSLVRGQVFIPKEGLSYNLSHVGEIAAHSWKL